jgi:LCP family protein required for cell wall assembly
MNHPKLYLDDEPLDQEERGLASKILTFLKWAGLVMLILLLGIVLFVWYNLSKLSVNPLDFGKLASTDGRTNILVLGVGDKGHAGQNLSDTMMVVSVNRKTNEVAMVSIPRDLRVPIPGHASGKINQANSYGGPKLAEQTVANALGIPIHYYLKTDFTGLKQAVDAVGGIDVTVKDRLYDPQYPCPDDKGPCGVDIKPGQYHMNGATALQYARCRKGTCGNDFGRASRQQEVIEKIETKVVRPSVYLNPKADAVLLTTFRNNIQTDMSINDLIEVGRRIHSPSRTIKFVFDTSPGGFLKSGGGSDLVPIGGTFTQIQAFMQSIFTQQIPDQKL